MELVIDLALKHFSLMSYADNGFRAYNVEPFREFFRNVFKEGGIGIVEMLYRFHLNVPIVDPMFTP